MISAEAINQFKAIILEDYGVALDDNEAVGLAEDYLVALEALLKPLRISATEDRHLTEPVEKRQNDN